MELSSGIDGLYLSGRASVPRELLAALGRGREEVELRSGPVPIDFGGEEFALQPRPLGKYRYCLQHRNGLLGVSPKSGIPPIRVQPRAEFLHGAGPVAVVDWFRNRLEAVFGSVLLSASRMDLHADWQGWRPEWRDRERFVGQARQVVLRAEGSDLTGLEFGRRKTATIVARIYDKTREVLVTGNDYVLAMWGDAYDPEQSVIRVEFELGRQGLREYGVATALDAIEAAGAIWASVTSTWLTMRTPTSDQTKARWPLAPEWEQVQRSRIASSALGTERVRAASDSGSIRVLAPALIGYLARFAALTGKSDVPGTFEGLRELLLHYERWTGVPFSDRIEQKRLELAI